MKLASDVLLEIRRASFADAAALVMPSAEPSPAPSLSATRPKATRAQTEVPSVLSKLTRRQLEILERALGGLSNDEIARDLGVSRNTVKTHRAGLYERLGVRSTRELLRFGRENGLAPSVPRLAEIVVPRGRRPRGNVLAPPRRPHSYDARFSRAMRVLG